MFFGGIGDARNLLRTIIDVAEYDRRPHSQKKSYHFTIVDINTCAITRDMILFMMLDEFSGQEPKSDEALETLSTIFYIYIATLMPHCAFLYFDRMIDKAIQALESGSQPLKWLYLHEQDIPKYLRILKQWKGEALQVFTVTQVINKVTKQLGQFKDMLQGMAPPLPTGCEQDKSLYFSTAMLTPPEKIMQLHDQEMSKLLKKYQSNPRETVSELKKHAKQHWKFNTTLVDVGFYYSLVDKNEYDIGHDPFQARESFEDKTLPSQPLKPSRLYDYLSPFFQDVANAIKHLRGRIQVEAMLGDFVDTAESIRFGLYHDKDDTSPSSSIITTNSRPRDFPILYDRIHLSNVPDYMGGHLSTFLYAAPLLKPFESSTVESNCLRNTGAWDSVESFLAHYQLIADQTMLRQLTQIKVIFAGDPFWPMGNYTKYRLAGTSLHQPFGELLPRIAFNKWFYGLFFSLASPFNLDLDDWKCIVYSPLTLTIIFRLIAHLRLLGYPSHWLSECLIAIIEDKVTSTCRPPRSSPSSIAEVKKEHSLKKLCTAPFKVEMGTLARIFEPLLPFALTSEAIPADDDVYHYTFHLPSHEKNRENAAASAYLALGFWDIRFVPRLGIIALQHDLRALLDPSWGDEVDRDFQGPAYEKFREKGLFLWSTITWDGEKKEASAWMSKSFVDSLVENKFHCGLYRTDNWTSIVPVTTAENVRDAVKMGRKWNRSSNLSSPVQK
ncbi:uncharacterized protein LY89DRAFT_19491 [Mollisia scopiformis]|uniref:DUF4470 domain-containing protein n=1 Tax=Mollisia scopiformis TaxID=149040 RepID=A0A194XVK9_MOLSC|nr:uncharacterized protein LY89DRAFT_19491 [Mollisia scopiformis]KUJ24365.1 hypothetical protein LY89DRAFT_19491 [Mollisia scopiformis]